MEISFHYFPLKWKFQKMINTYFENLEIINLHNYIELCEFVYFNKQIEPNNKINTTKLPFSHNTQIFLNKNNST